MADAQAHGPLTRQAEPGEGYNRVERCCEGAANG